MRMTRSGKSRLLNGQTSDCLTGLIVLDGVRHEKLLAVGQCREGE